MRADSGAFPQPSGGEGQACGHRVEDGTQHGAPCDGEVVERLAHVNDRIDWTADGTPVCAGHLAEHQAESLLAAREGQTPRELWIVEHRGGVYRTRVAPDEATAIAMLDEADPADWDIYLSRELLPSSPLRAVTQMNEPPESGYRVELAGRVVESGMNSMCATEMMARINVALGTATEDEFAFVAALAAPPPAVEGDARELLNDVRTGLALADYVESDTVRYYRLDHEPGKSLLHRVTRWLEANPASPVETGAREGDGAERRWWVYSDEDNAEPIMAREPREAAERWLRRQVASEFHDVYDGTSVYVQPIVIERFAVEQTNPAYTDDVPGAEPAYEIVGEPRETGDDTRKEGRDGD